MKAVGPPCAVGEVVFKTQADATKGQLAPGDLFWMAQADLKALLASGKVRVGHAAAIEQMDLVDMCDADHGERRINQYPCSCLFVGFTNCRLRSGLAIFHKTGWKRPESVLWLNGSAAQKDSILPFSDATDHQAGIFIVDVAARIADVSR